MSTERTYLDHNATAPLRPQAAEVLVEVFGTAANASSVHAEGRAARARIEQARDQVKALVDAADADLVFTSGGTEANNLAIDGIAAAGGIGRILVSSMEHPSVLEPARAAGLPVREIAATPEGLIDLEDLAAALGESADRALVSVMAANNETGAVQPLAEVGRLAREHEALLHTDAVQAAGRIDVDFAGLGCDLMTLSAHKIGGPQGAGALVLKRGLTLRARTLGGGQEDRRRAGTENVAAIAGFGAAAAFLRGGDEERAAVLTMRDDMERRIAEHLPDAVIIAAAAQRLPNTTCVAVPGVAAEFLLIALDLEGFAVSAGSACSSGKVARSHVLAAMGLEPSLADGAIRVSIGWNTVQQDVQRFAEALAACCTRKRTAAAEVAA